MQRVTLEGGKGKVILAWGPLTEEVAQCQSLDMACKAGFVLRENRSC